MAKNKENQEKNTITIHYHFELEGRKSYNHDVIVSKEDAHSILDINLAEAPEWTKLKNHQCEGCTLKGTEHCPVALRLVTPIEKFRNTTSYIKTKIIVKTMERTYFKETDLQDGLRSLFGLIMATSGCPAMEPFRPMARFHMPFSSIDETVYRVLSMYLLKRFFELEPNQDINVNMSDIQGMYDAIQRVNRGIFTRLKNMVEKDGMLNAVAILDSFATLVPFYVDEKMEKVRKLFISTPANKN